MTAIEQISVPFYGTLIEVVRKGGGIWVVLLSICNSLGIDEAVQRDVLLAAPWALTVFIVLSVDNQEHLGLSLACLPTWLHSLRPGDVPAGRQALLKFYQREASDWIGWFVLGECPTTQGG